MREWLDRLAPVVSAAQTKLRARGADVVAQMSGCVRDAEGNLRVILLGREYLVSPYDFRVCSAVDLREASSFVSSLILTYLASADGTPPSGTWVGFRELPDGIFYVQAFQGYSGERLVRELQGGLTAFHRAAQQVGGQALALGSAAYAFDVLPRVRLAVVYWEGDDECPSQAQVLFDRSASHYLPTDGLAILGSQLVGLLLKAASQGASSGVVPKRVDESESKTMNEKPLEGLVALVTGAGRGIGRSIAMRLAAAGARVALAARSEGELQAVQQEIIAAGGEAACFPTDVAQEDQVARLVAATVEHFGRLDIVVNNAGIGYFAPLEHTSVEQWDKMMAVNARGPFLVCREALPHLRRSPHPYIVNISSVVGLKGYPNQAGYSASKHALLGMTKALAREVQSDGIRVHAICPGGVDTGLIGDARPDLDRSELIRPEEIAEIVLFLVTCRGNAVIDEIDVRRRTATPWG